MSQSTEALMHANLLEVFGERDRERRLAAIRRTYTEGIVALDPEEVVEGYAALDAKVQRLLDDAPDFVFSAAGPVLVNHDMGYLAWSFGPEDREPVVRGFDACIIEDGRIAKIYTMLLPS